MDKIISEFEGSWVRFLMSIPLDVLTFVSLLYLITAIVFYLLGKWKNVSSVITGVLSIALFVYYYLCIRPSLLNVPSLILICTISLSLCLLLVPILLSTRFRISRLILIGKLRWFFEYFVALTILVLSLPLIIIIALLVKLTTYGTLFVREHGYTHSGKPITLYSFRTKVPIYAYSIRVFLMSSEQDSRFTWFGRILHRSSLHLLPRLWNVLTGDLHLIGMTPLDSNWMESRFFKNLLASEYALVSEFYDVYEGELFRKVVDYCFPVGLITYADLQAYKVILRQVKVIKSLDQRPRLLKEANYFLNTNLPSIRLFITLIGKFFFRLLTAMYIIKFEEVMPDVLRREPNHESR